MRTHRTAVQKLVYSDIFRCTKCGRRVSLVRNAQSVALLSQQATREANILAYNDVFLLVTALALLTMAWLLARWLYTICILCPAPSAGNAQTGLAKVSLNNSGPR